MRGLILLVVLALQGYGQERAGLDTYMGWAGRWVVVDATAYSPRDPIDGDHWSSKDHVTAAMKDWRTHPYGIAVPMTADQNGRRTVPAFVPYGTKIIIPRGYGYLDRSRADDRLFEADDTGGRISTLTKQAKDGVPVIDLRFQDSADATKWAGPTGRRRLMVFVVEGSAQAPQPAVVEDITAQEKLRMASSMVDYLQRELAKRERLLREKADRLAQETEERERSGKKVFIIWALAIGVIVLVNLFFWIRIRFIA